MQEGSNSAALFFGELERHFRFSGRGHSGQDRDPALPPRLVEGLVGGHHPAPLGRLPGEEGVSGTGQSLAHQREQAVYIPVERAGAAIVCDLFGLALAQGTE